MTSFAETLLRLESVLHFRDLGGHVTTDGHIVRQGRLYRSGAFSHVTDQDLSQVQTLKIASICDLRGEDERTRAPNRWPQDQATKVILLNVTDDRTLWRRLSSTLSAESARTLMIEVYRRMPRSFVSVLPVLIARLLEPDGLPAVIHCTAGKDRTGFACALLLLTLGVPRDAVYQDYLLSTELDGNQRALDFITRELTLRTGTVPDSEAIRPFITVKPEYLDTALDTMTAEY
ncbi:MAG: tyrosine-protein phosphatase, partial [Candidatus Binatia bacterium]